MYRGINAIKMDDKGRMSIPAKYRDALKAPDSTGIVVTIDTESPCLLLYPKAVWEEIETKLQALPSFDRAARRIQRLLIGHATDLELDNSGRILIPTPLREYAGLSQATVLVGQGNKFEIWSEVNWQNGRAEWLESARTDQEEALPDQVRQLSL